MAVAGAAAGAVDDAPAVAPHASESIHLTRSRQKPTAGFRSAVGAQADRQGGVLAPPLPCLMGNASAAGVKDWIYDDAQ